MRSLYMVLLLALRVVPSDVILASQDTQAPKAPGKPLTNADILDMLKAGLSQEIVVAEIRASACEFDTTPAALKELKAANIPDAVILAMVEAPSGQDGISIASKRPRETSEHARVDCNHAEPVPVFPIDKLPVVGNGIQNEAFNVKCGDRITVLGPADNQTWLKIRTADGQVGYISFAVVSREQTAESTHEGHPSSESKKQEDVQKANDDLEDCRVSSQNEYDRKMNVIGTMSLSPMMRVYAANKIKQNLDAELRACRSQYESRLKIIGAE